MLTAKITAGHRYPRFFFLCLADEDYGLVWKVRGYDDRYPDEYDLAIFDKIGVYGSLKRNNLHDSYMGACEPAI